MESVIRAAVMYAFLILMIRLSGRRTLGEMSSFDFILMLVVGEATQQALLDDDHSITNSWIVILSLIGLDIAMSAVKQRLPTVACILDGMPTILLRDGEPIKNLMTRSRVDESDILHAARESQGLERLDQIKYAILEPNGQISIIPRD